MSDDGWPRSVLQLVFGLLTGDTQLDTVERDPGHRAHALPLAAGLAVDVVGRGLCTGESERQQASDGKCDGVSAG